MKPTILIIDAAGSHAEELAAKLNKEAYTVLVARSKEEAVEMLAPHEKEPGTMGNKLSQSELEAFEALAAQKLAETRARFVKEIEQKDKEFDAFSYSVSHDLRAPLRSLDGFSHALLDEYVEKLDAQGQDYLNRIRAAAQRMNEFIEGLVQLSRIHRVDMQRADLDLSPLAKIVIDELKRQAPERKVMIEIQESVLANGDSPLLRLLLETLIGNAWKFTSKTPHATIEFGATKHNESSVYFVRDNGAGFDMTYADKLFSPFQRLHKTSEFPGAGMGLATAYRIVDRHGGHIWAESKVDAGASLFFTLGPVLNSHS